MRCLGLLLAFLFVQDAFANVVPASVLKAQKTEAARTVEKNQHGNSIQIGSVVKSLSARTEDVANNQDVQLNPNTPAGISLGWSNKFLGLSLVGNISNGARDKSKVHTSAEDYQLRYFNNTIGVEFIYQNYQGFNQSAASSDTDGFITESEYTLNELSINMLQLQFDWAFYGVSALDAFGPTWEKPRQDGTAFYITSSLSQVTLENPQPFLPQGSTGYGDDATLTTGVYKTLGLGIGASYLWQWTRFYAAAFASIQGGPQKQEYKTTTMEWDNVKYVWFPQAKFVIGYDWGSWYVNAIFHTHRVSVNLKDTNFAFFSQDGGIYLGSRF